MKTPFHAVGQFLTFYADSEPRQAIDLPVGGHAKRWLDIVLAATALVIFGPLMLLLALLVRLSVGGNVFYGHERMGWRSHSFRCIKFRTMIPDADIALQCLLAKSPALAKEWESHRKLKQDPRITPVGHFLRRSSLDELPQLFNVLRGEMSLVGPRPIVRDEVQKYGRDAVHYFRARPGITGAWQASGRNDVSYSDRVAMDRQYVERWSIVGDLLIILRTVPAVLSRRGSC